MGAFLDTTKLVVGQDVYVRCGKQYREGNVVKVIPDGVEVVKATPDGVDDVYRAEVQTRWSAGPLRFDKYGNGVGDGIYGVFECVVSTDTKKLVVGQVVHMFAGIYGCDGKVVKVTPSGAEVYHANDGCTINTILHFYANGFSWDDDGTFEYGPWYIAPVQEVASTAGRRI